MTDAADVFAAFRSEVVPQTPLRSAITAAYRVPEPECVPPLLEARDRERRRGEPHPNASPAAWSASFAPRRDRAGSKASSTNIRSQARRAWR